MKLWIASDMTKIYRIDLGSCNCYLLEKNGRYVLVDSGTRKEREKLERLLTHLMVKRIDAIFMTHVHKETVGNAAYLSRKYHCKVYVDKEEMSLLMDGTWNGKESRNPIFQFMDYCLYGKKLQNEFEGVNNAASYPEGCKSQVDSICGKKEWNLTILRTKGHTKGSVSIIVAGEVALVGDAMSHTLVGSIYPAICEEEEEVLPSWRKLLGQHCKLYLPTHGRAIKRRMLSESYSVFLYKR